MLFAAYCSGENPVASFRQGFSRPRFAIFMSFKGRSLANCDPDFGFSKCQGKSCPRKVVLQRSCLLTGNGELYVYVGISEMRNVKHCHLKLQFIA